MPRNDPCPSRRANASAPARSSPRAEAVASASPLTGSTSVVSTPSPRDQRPDRKLSRVCDAMATSAVVWIPRYRRARLPFQPPLRDAFTRQAKRRIVAAKYPARGGDMRHRCSLALSLSIVAALAGPSLAASYQPDPRLLAAAQKEGEVVLYTTQIVDQI